MMSANTKRLVVIAPLAFVLVAAHISFAQTERSIHDDYTSAELRLHVDDIRRANANALAEQEHWLYRTITSESPGGIRDARTIDARKDFEDYANLKRAELANDKRCDRMAAKIFRNSGVQESNWFYVGSKPGDANYRGAGGDQDVIVTSKAEANRILAEARRVYGDAGVEIRDGRFHIRALDIEVWDPDSMEIEVAVRKKLRDPNVSPEEKSRIIRENVEGDMEIYKESVRKRKSLDQTVRDVHDSEFLFGAVDEFGDQSKAKPGVMQHVKKAETHFRGDVPDDPLKRQQFVQELAKSQKKAIDTVDPDGHRGLVDAKTRAELDALKAGKSPVGIIYEVDDSPEVKKKKLGDFRDRVSRVFVEALDIERDQRAAELELKSEDLRELDYEIAKAEKDNRPESIDELKKRKTSLEQDIARIKNRQVADDMTGHVLGKKNKRVRDSILDKTGGGGQSKSTMGDKMAKAYGLSVIGKGFGIWAGFEREYLDSILEQRAFSQANMVSHVTLNMTGITQAIVSYDQVSYEMGKGWEQATNAEKHRFRKLGIDLEELGKPVPGETEEEKQQRLTRKKALEDLIWRRVALRNSIRATWHGTKAIPLIGDIVGSAQDTYEIAEAGIGGVVDAIAIEDSRARDQKNREWTGLNAVRMARISVEQMQECIRVAESIEKELEGNREQVAKFEEFVSVMRERLATNRELLKSLTEGANPGDLPVQVDTDQLNKLRNNMKSVNTDAKKVTFECEQLIGLLKRQQVTIATAIERSGSIRRSLMQLDARFIQTAEEFKVVESQIAGAGEARVATQTYQTIVDERERLAKMGRAYQQLGTVIQKRLQDYERIVASFDASDARFKYIKVRFDGDSRWIKPGTVEHNKLLELIPIHRELSIDRGIIEPIEVTMADLRHVLAQAKHVYDLELPPVPNSIANQPVNENLAREFLALVQPRREMVTALEAARDKFVELRKLLATDPPVFDITKHSFDGKTFRFTVRSLRVPKGLTVNYIWVFSDGAEPVEGTSVARTFEKAGRYTIRLIARRMTPKFTEILGEAETTVEIAGPRVAVKPPADPPPPRDRTVNANTPGFSVVLDPVAKTIRGSFSVKRAKGDTRLDPSTFLNRDTAFEFDIQGTFSGTYRVDPEWDDLIVNGRVVTQPRVITVYKKAMNDPPFFDKWVEADERRTRSALNHPRWKAIKWSKQGDDAFELILDKSSGEGVVEIDVGLFEKSFRFKLKDARPEN